MNHSELRTTYLPEHQSVPECMCRLARCSQVREFSLACLPEQLALEPGHITRHLRGLVEPVQHAGDAREKVRAEDLDVLKQAQRVTRE